MKELDLLKKHWNDNKTFHKVSTETFNKLIHKKSSSTVYWIFWISIIEFILSLVLNFFIPKDISNFSEFLNHWEIEISIVAYLISFAFIWLFYKMYREISVASTTKTLMKNILKARKILKYYITYNLALTAIILTILYCEEIDKQKVTENDMHLIIIQTIVYFVFCILSLVAIWFVYRLFYGWLIKRLKFNYNELEKELEE